MDLEGKRVISKERSERYALKINALYAETSAKDNIGINTLFQIIVEEVLKRKSSGALSRGASGKVSSRGTANAEAASTNKVSVRLSENRAKNNSCC